MKKYVALLLALVLVFSMGVPSFAVSVTGDVSVNNWPSYFTGAYDSNILSELQSIDILLAVIDANTMLIRDDVTSIYELLLTHFNAQVTQMQIELDYWSKIINLLSLFKDIVDDHIQLGLFPLMEEQHDETLTAIDSATIAVHTLISHVVQGLFPLMEEQHDETLTAFVSFWDEWNYQYYSNDTEGTAGYALYMLQQVLADEDDLAMKNSLADSKTEVVDFVGNGVTSSGGSSLSLMSGITDGISFATDFNEYFSMPDVGMSDIFYIFDTTDESLIWFTDVVANDIDTVSSTYSRRNNPQTDIVTSYYEDRQAEFTEKWGDIIG